jgi:hypothetical protein
MITMVAGLLGSTNALAGWLVHLGIAVFAGVGFATRPGRWHGRSAGRTGSRCPVSDVRRGRCRICRARDRVRSVTVSVTAGR